MDRPWIIAHDATQGDDAYAVECTRCGIIQRVALPITIDCYVALAKAFGKSHRYCRDGLKAAKAKGR